MFDALTKQLKIKFNNNDSNTILIENENIQFQKWNHIVINYISGTVDIIINNNIVNTSKNVKLEDGISDVIVGQVDGIPGRITNVAYFNEPLRGDLINHIYKSNSQALIPRNSNILGNTFFLFNRMGTAVSGAISGVDDTLYTTLDINSYIPEIDVSPKRGYKT